MCGSAETARHGKKVPQDGGTALTGVRLCLPEEKENTMISSLDAAPLWRKCFAKVPLTDAPRGEHQLHAGGGKQRARAAAGGEGSHKDDTRGLPLLTYIIRPNETTTASRDKRGEMRGRKKMTKRWLYTSNRRR
ncbi:hypothetical protein Q5P01_017554 [Channa striata]|uniref:Uncharacterized protein n=1 Tax=Channa striata TaxID=64152 RepID=A0AA88MA61_CHASR|nr:hypothetical protein Q5P01_017554 [Channa striata]